MFDFTYVITATATERKRTATAIPKHIFRIKMTPRLVVRMWNEQRNGLTNRDYSVTDPTGDPSLIMQRYVKIIRDKNDHYES